MHFYPRLRFLVTLGLLAIAVGCGDGRPVRVPVSGQVLIDGKPLAYGGVRFFPAAGRPSSGDLDKDGRFQLTCYEQRDGAMLGRHQVEITACERIDDTKSRWHAPKKYSSAATSEITRQIDAPQSDLVINLTWNGGSPFVETCEADPFDRPGAKNRDKRPK